MKISEGMLAVVAAGLVAAVVVYLVGGSGGHSTAGAAPTSKPPALGMGPTINCRGTAVRVPPIVGSVSPTPQGVSAVNDYPNTQAFCAADFEGFHIVFDLMSNPEPDLWSMLSPYAETPVNAPLTGEFSDPTTLRLLVPPCLNGQGSAIARIEDDEQSPARDLRPAMLTSLVTWVNHVRDNARCAGPRLAATPFAPAPPVTTRLGSDVCRVQGAGLPHADGTTLYQRADPPGTDAFHCWISRHDHFDVTSDDPGLKGDPIAFTVGVVRGPGLPMPHPHDYEHHDSVIPGFRGSATQGPIDSQVPETTTRLSTTCHGVPLQFEAFQQNDAPLPPPTQMFALTADAIARQMGCEPVTAP